MQTPRNILILSVLAVGIAVVFRFKYPNAGNTIEGDLRSQAHSMGSTVGTTAVRTLSRNGARPGPDDTDEQAMAVLHRLDPKALIVSLLSSWNEPFSPDLIALAARRFVEAKDPYVKFQLAMLLHRYGRAEGTEFLRSALRQSGGDFQELAAQALVMARDRGSVGVIAEYLRASAVSPPIDLLKDLGNWQEPELVEALRFAFRNTKPPSPAFAKALALMGDYGAMDALAGEAWLYSRELENTAMAIRKNGASNPGWIAGLFGESTPKNVPTEFLMDACRTAGAAAAAGPVESLLRELASAQKRSNSEYLEHIRALRANEKDWAPFESDARSYDLTLKSIQLLGEWAQPSSAEAVYEYLGAYLGGKYSPYVLEKIISVAAAVDPKDFENRLLAMGVSSESISSSLAQSKLTPVPAQFLPRQVNKLTPIRIPGED